VLARSWLTPTSAFRKSDRRDLPGADERNGDAALVGRPAAPLLLCHESDRHDSAVADDAYGDVSIVSAGRRHPVRGGTDAYVDLALRR
jgi:hypothetical protein